MIDTPNQSAIETCMTVRAYVAEMRSGTVGSPAFISVPITIGAGFFIFALLLAALIEPSLRILHALQALPYVAILVLTRRNSAWGFGIGCFLGAFWSYAVLVGLHNDIADLFAGRVFRPDVILQFAAAIGQCAMVVACFVGFLRTKPHVPAWLSFCGSGILSVGYLILIVALFRPQSLPLLLHAFG